MNQKKQQDNELGENELVSWLDQKMGHLQPYWSQIALGICVLFLTGIGIAFFLDRTQTAEATKWQGLAIAQGNYRRTLDNNDLIDFGGEYPNDPAGLWAMLFAADAEMRSGLADFATDRKTGFDKIRKAQEYYQQVVDSSVKKSTMLQRRSVFGLAYALESSGEFARAAELYQQLVDAADETPFTEVATRGLERATNPQFAALFEKFRDYAADPEVAPGMRLPPRPNITFPDPSAEQPDIGGGEFGSQGNSSPAAEAGDDSNIENQVDEPADNTSDSG